MVRVATFENHRQCVLLLVFLVIAILYPQVVPGDMYASRGSVILDLDGVLIIYLLWMKSSSLAYAGTCQIGYYASDSTLDCQECSSCTPGQGVLHPCTNTSNTVCIQCAPLDMFSALNFTTTSHHCYNCTDCSKTHRHQTTVCNETTDARCGDCLSGYFLGVDESGSTVCLECSRCPPDNVAAVRWRDCEKSGLSRDMWCSPGYIEQETTTLLTVTATDLSLQFLGTESFLAFPHDNLNTEGDPSMTTIVLIASAACCLVLTAFMTACLMTIVCRRRIRTYNLIEMQLNAAA